jgi:hypothetical protein
MSDLERDIRELLDEETRSAPPPHEAGPVVRRTRRRQGAVIAGGALAAVALVAASFVGLRAIDRAERSTFVDQPTVTTSFNGITISHPESWHVVDPDEAGLNDPESMPDLPKLVLALSPIGRGELLGCPGMVEGSAAPTFLLTIQEQPMALTGDATRPWPVELEPLQLGANDGPGGGESVCYPGWTFRQATWTAAGRTFEAAVGLAPDVSDADRDALLDAFASMTFEPVENGSAAAVLDEGEIGGETWQLIASRGDEGLVLSLETNDGAAGIGGFVTGTRDLQFGEMVVGTGDGAGLVVFGAVPPGTAEIECPPPAGSRTLDVPDAIDDRFEAFLVFVDVGLEIELHAVDAEGNVIASGRAGSQGNDPTKTPVPDEVVFRGRTNECFWILARTSLGQDQELLHLASRDGDPLVQLVVDIGDEAPPLQLASFTCPIDPGGTLVFGLSTENVADLQWPTSAPDESGVPECWPAEFPARFCLFLLDGVGDSGEAIALDANGDEIGRASFP